MKMNVFEFTVMARGNDVAGFDNFEHAVAFAKSIANTEHCDVDIINAFTGEVHKSYVCYKTVVYNAEDEMLECNYSVSERVW